SHRATLLISSSTTRRQQNSSGRITIAGFTRTSRTGSGCEPLPKGDLKIAHAFKRGIAAKEYQVPEGRPNHCHPVENWIWLMNIRWARPSLRDLRDIGPSPWQ